MKTKHPLFFIILAACLNFFLNTTLKAQAVNVSDSLALIDIYDSCNGPNWRYNTNWLTGPVSTWYGVTVTGTRVTDLNLNFNYLTGSLPQSFGNLTALKTFSCEDNHLTGNIPATIGNLVNLTSFSMYDNQLTGEIPSTIGNMISLTDLQLGHNYLTGSLPASLGNLINMQVLSITYDSLSGTIPASLGNLTKMNTLYLNDNNLTGEVPATFTNLSSLRIMLLLDNHLSQSTNSYPVHGGIDYINFNNFNFNGLEQVAQQMPQDIYYPQLDINIQQKNDSTLYLSAGGTLSNNTYTWYLAGEPDISTTITADSTFQPAQPGQYFAQVNNAVATQLTLYTDTVNFIPPVDTTNNDSLALKFRASDTSATNINSAKDKNGNEFIVYKDLATGKATVRRFTGTKWQTIGKAKFSAGAVYYPSIALNATGTPYVIYQDKKNGYKATVMMFNGSAWMPVGAPGISVGTAAYTSITIAKNGTLFIAYQDAGLGNIAVVKSYNGSSWTSAQGSLPVSVADYISLIAAPDGKIYLACSDKNLSSKARVISYNGTSWSNVGNAGFSAGVANLISLKFDNNKTPYVVYQDGNDGHGTMMKLQSNQWVTVGKRNEIGNGTVRYITFDFDTLNTPYTSFEDVASHSYLTVEKFNGSKWINVGAKGFTKTQSEYTNMFFDKQHLPSVVYTDFGRNFKAVLTQFSNGKWSPQQQQVNDDITAGLQHSGLFQNSSALLYPNPANSNAQLSFTSKNNSWYKLIITDEAGKMLVTKQGTAIAGHNIINIDMHTYLPGIYYVQLLTKDNNEKQELIKR